MRIENHILTFALIRKLAWGLQILSQKPSVFRARDFQRSERREMARKPLRIEQAKSPFPQPHDESVQRNFRGVGDLVKHRLTKKRAAKRYSIEPAGEFAVEPRL